MTATIEDITSAVEGLDPNLDPNLDTFRSALLLLSSAVVGPDEAKVAAFTGLPAAFVAERAERLRASGVWTGEGKIAADWWDEETGGIAFWIDVNVAEGLMERATD